MQTRPRLRMTLDAFLDRRGIKAKWLAEKIGASPQQMSKWMNNRVAPEAVSLLLMAHVLGCKVEDIADLRFEDDSE